MLDFASSILRFKAFKIFAICTMASGSLSGPKTKIATIKITIISPNS